MRLRAEVVWEYLTRHNLSQNAFARRQGIDPGYFSQLMNGRRSPSPEMRARLMRALAISDFDDLFALLTLAAALGLRDGVLMQAGRDLPRRGAGTTRQETLEPRPDDDWLGRTLRGLSRGASYDVRVVASSPPAVARWRERGERWPATGAAAR